MSRDRWWSSTGIGSRIMATGLFRPSRRPEPGVLERQLRGLERRHLLRAADVLGEGELAQADDRGLVPERHGPRLAHPRADEKGRALRQTRATFVLCSLVHDLEQPLAL